MAIYHFSKKYVSRGRGSSAVGAAAYRAAERLFDERRGRYYNFTAKTGVIHSEILLPERAPERLFDRATLWNEVEARERQKNARLADEIEVAIPREMTQAQGVTLVRDFVTEQFVKRGMVADLNIHWDLGSDGGPRPHAHVLLSTRIIDSEGFGLKGREWKHSSLLRAWRKAWADHVNERLAMLDIDARIDHRSLKAQGIDLEPQHKIGAAGARRAVRGDDAERADDHRRIACENGARIIADPSIALDAITRSQSTFTTRDLAMFVHRHSDGQAQFDLVMAAVRASPELVALGQDSKRQARFTSREMVAVEQRLERAGSDLVRRADHAVAQSARDHALRSAERRGFSLSSEQRATFEHISGTGAFASVIGYAGTGKSTMLSVAREAWEAAGYHVRGATLSGIAAKNLENGSGMSSRTIASFEYQWQRGRGLLTSRDVLIIDEAGMIGTRQLERVVTAVRDAGAKIVLVGDPAQLQAIEAGAAFRSLVERHGAVELTAIRRQRAQWQREATQALAMSRTAEAVRAYQHHGMLKIAESRDLARADLIERWGIAQIATPGETRIILTHSNAEVHRLNIAARVWWRDAGRLGDDVEWAVGRGARAFASGDHVMFFKNDRDLAVKNGSLGKIEQVDAERMTVRLDDGHRVDFALRDYAHVDHGYAATIHKAQGLTVDHTHILATPGLDRHSAYVALSRHRDGLQLHYGRDDFDDLKSLVRALSRDRAKDMASDYGRTYQQELRVFAKRRGLEGNKASVSLQNWPVYAEVAPPVERDVLPRPDTAARSVFQGLLDRSRIQGDVDLDRDWPNVQRARFAALKLNAARILSSLHARADKGDDDKELAYAVVRMSRSVLAIVDARTQGLPILPYHRETLSRTIDTLDELAPGGSQDLVSIFERQPTLLKEAAAGRAGRAMDAMTDEVRVRADPQLRAERFVERWQALARKASAAERDRDTEGATAIAATLAHMAKTLERDPQVNAILRDRGENLGLRGEVRQERHIRSDLGRTPNQAPEQELDR